MRERQLEPADETSNKVANTEKPKYICVYIANWPHILGNHHYDSFINAIDLSKLFSCKQHDQIDSISQRVFTTCKPCELKLGTGMVVATDGSLYVATSEYPSDSPNQMLKYSLSANHQFQQVEDDHLDTTNPSFSRKLFPILVQIKQCIYALHNPYKDFFPVDKHFEVYDLTRHVWRTLEPPPIDYMNSDFDGYLYSYIVVGKYLHVSTNNMSFAFDTEREAWERCDLFSTYYDNHYPLDWVTRACYNAHIELKRRPFLTTRPQEVEMGVPFPSVRTGLEYDGYLLCVMWPFGRNVVAFKIVDGKVGEPEILLKHPDPKPMANIYDHIVLVAFGGGEFCLVTSNDNLLDFTKFKVLKNSPDGRLTCSEAEVEVSRVIMGDHKEHLSLCLDAVAL